MAYYLISTDFAGKDPETLITWKGVDYYYDTEDPDRNPAFSELGMGLNVASGDEVTVLAGDYEVIMSSGWYTNSGTITISNVKYDADHAATEDDIYADTSVYIQATLKNNGTFIVQSADPDAVLEFSITKLTNADAVSIAGALVEIETLNNTGSVVVEDSEFTATNLTNAEGKTFTLTGSKFTAENTIVNDGTFYVTNSDIDAEFDGGEISLTGTFGDATDITGAADITATSVTLNGDASIAGSKLTVAGDGIDLNGTASLSADEVVLNSRIYANGVNTLDLSNITGSAIISARTGATLANSSIDRTVYFSNNTTISGTSYIKTVSIKGTSIDPESSGYRSLTITGDFASDKIDTGTSAGTKPNSAFISFNDATADLGTLAVTGQSIITVTNSTVGAGTVNLSGVINVEGESSLVFEKVSPNTAYGDSTINAGGATLNNTEIAKTSATFAVAEATTLTLKGENSILANIANDGTIILNSEGEGDEFEAAFLKGNVTGNVVISENAVVLDNDPETAAKGSAQVIKGDISDATVVNNTDYTKYEHTTGYYLTLEDKTTLYVNSEYAITDGSAITSDGHIFGFNAFNSLGAALANLADDTAAIEITTDTALDLPYTVEKTIGQDLTISGDYKATFNFSGHNDLVLTVTEGKTLTLAAGTTLETTGEDGYIVLGGAGAYAIQGTVDSVSQVAFWTDATVSGNVVSLYTLPNTGMVLFRSAKNGDGAGVVIAGGEVDTGRAFLVSGKLTAVEAEINASVLQFTQNLDEASATPWWASEVVNENGEALLGAKFFLTSTDSTWTIGDIEAAGDNAVIDGEFTFTGDEVNVSGNANLGDTITLNLIASDMTVGGTLSNAGTIAMSAGSTLTAKELQVVENGSVTVTGADNTLDIKDLDGTISFAEGTTILASTIGDTGEIKDGTVEITAGSVYFQGTSDIQAKIENSGKMVVGVDASNTGTLTAGTITNATNTAGIVINKNSTLKGATIVNNGTKNVITIKNGTLDGVTVRGGTIAYSAGPIAFTGVSEIDGVTIKSTKAASSISVNGTLTVDTASSITISNVTFADDKSYITVKADSTLTNPRVIFTFADTAEGRANAAALMAKITADGAFVAQQGNLIYAAKATPETQGTILVNNEWIGDGWGTPYVIDEDTYYNGINAFGSLSDLTYNHAKDGAFVEDATVVTASTIILKNGDTYEYTTPAFLFADNEEGVTLQGETGVATSVSITGSKSFYLMGAVDVENEAGYATAITEAAKNAQKFTIANGLTVNVSDLRVGMPVNYDDFDPEFPESTAGAPKRQASVADLTISGTVVLPKVDGRLVAGPLSKISVTADGKVVIPDEAVINAGASLSVTGDAAVKAATGYQYAGGSLHIIDGAAVTFKDTKASLSYGYNMYYGYSHNTQPDYSSFTNKAFINVDGWGDLATYKPADNTITLTFDSTILDVVAGDYGMADSFFVFNKASVGGDMAKLPAVVLNVKNGSDFDASFAALNLEEGSDVTVNVDESSLSVNSVVSYGKINLTGKKVSELITTASLEAAVIDNDGTIDADYATITAGGISNGGTFEANNSTITVAAEVMEDPSDYMFFNIGTATALISNSTLTAGNLKGSFTLVNDDVTAQIVEGTLSVSGSNTLALGTKDGDTQTGDMSGATILLNLGATVSGSIFAAGDAATFAGGTIETDELCLKATIGDLDAAKTQLVNEDGKALDIKGAATFADVVNGSINTINIVSTAATETAPAIDASLTAGTIDNAGRINVGSVNEVAASLTGTTITNSGIVNVFKNSTVEVTAGILNDGGDTPAQFNLKAGSTIIGDNGVYMNLGNGVFNVNGATVSKLGINTAYEDAPNGKAEIVITDSVIDLGTGSGTSVINATKAKTFTIEGESTVVARINGTVTLLDDTTLTDSTIIKYGNNTATIKVAEDAEVIFSGASTVSTFVNGGDVTVDGSLTTGALTNNGTITVDGSLKATSISKVGDIVMDATDTLTVTNAIAGEGTIAISGEEFALNKALITAGSGLLGTTITINGIEVGNGDTVLGAYTVIKTDKILSLVELASTETLYVNKDYSATDAGGHAWGVNAFVFLTSAINNMADDTETIVVESSRVATGLSNVTIAPKAEAGTLEITGEDVDVELGFKGADQGLYLKPGVEISGVNITTTATDGDAWTGSVYVNHAAAAGSVTIDGDITAAGHIYFCGSAEVTGDLTTAGESQILFRAGKAGEDAVVTVDGSMITSAWIVMVSGKTEITDSSVMIGSFGYDNYDDSDAAPIFGSTNSNWTIGELDLVHKQTPGTTRAAATINLDNSAFNVTGEENTNGDSEAEEAAEIGKAITINLVKASTISVANGTLKNDGNILSDGSATVISAKAIDNSGTIEAATVSATGAIGNAEGALISAANVTADAQIENLGSIEASDAVTAYGIRNHGSIEAASVSTIDGENASNIANFGSIEAGVVYDTEDTDKVVGATGTVTANDAILNNEDAEIIAKDVTAAAIENAGDITAFGTVKASNLANTGDISAATLDVTTTDTEKKLSNNGTIEVATLKARRIENNAGSITVTESLDATQNVIAYGGEINLSGSVKAAALNAQMTGTINITDATSVDVVGTIYVYSTMTATNSDLSDQVFSVNAGGNLTVTDSDITGITLTGTMKLDDMEVAGASVAGTFEIISDSAFSGINTVGGLTIDETATLTIDANESIHGHGPNLIVDGTFTNAGEIVIDATGLVWGTAWTPIQVVSAEGIDWSAASITVTTGDPDNQAIALIQNDGIYLYKHEGEVDLTTIVVSNAWANTAPGTTVEFGEDEYVLGFNAFAEVTDVNFTADTEEIKFASNTTAGIYGELALSNSTDITVWNAAGTTEGGTLSLASFAVDGSGKDETRINIGEAKDENWDADTVVKIAGDVSISKADVDFDDSETTIGGNVSIIKSEVEFDRNTTISGTLTLDGDSVIEADQGYAFILDSDDLTDEVDEVSTINGKLLVTSKDATGTNKTVATLGTITGTGKIYTDVKSELSFGGYDEVAENAFAGTTYINVDGLTLSSTKKTFAINGGDFKVSDKYTEDEAAYGDYRKYFVVVGEGAEAKLTQLEDADGHLACHTYYVSSESAANTGLDIAKAYTWKWNDGSDHTSYADRIVVTGGDFTGTDFVGTETKATSFFGVAANVVDGGTFSAKRTLGGKTLRDGSAWSYEQTKGNYDLTINDGTFNTLLIAGDRVTAGSGVHIGNIGLTINGGNFAQNVAGGMLYDQKVTDGTAAVSGNISLTITGGTFYRESSAMTIYGGNVASNTNYSANTTVYGNITVKIDALDEISMQQLIVGSYGKGRVTGNTTLILSGDGSNLSADRFWGGSGSDYYEATETTKMAKSTVEGTRTLSFIGFNGDLNVGSIKMFDYVTIDGDSDINFGRYTDDEGKTVGFGGTMADISYWTIGYGSENTGAFLNDFTGDTLALTGLADMAVDEESGIGKWIIFDDTSKFAADASGDKLAFASVSFDDNAAMYSLGIETINEKDAMVLTKQLA